MKAERMMKIKALVMDVDGTLTDGAIYLGNDGEEMKMFHVKDGYAIKHILPQMGIIPIIITGKNSKIVQMRCDELGITRIVQGSVDKVADLKKALVTEQIGIEETAYIGDDMNDYECMSLVGLSGCPSDAAEEIKTVADYVTKTKGGKGAVREFIEWMKRQML